MALVDDLKFMIEHPRVIGKDDRKVLLEAIGYLKKVKTIEACARSMLDNSQLLDSYKKSKETIEEEIKKCKSEIERLSIPTPEVTGDGNLSAPLRVVDKNIKEQERARAEENRNKKLLSTKKRLHLLEESNKKLDEVQKFIGNPEKIVESIISIGGFEDVAKAREELINICATGMASGYMEGESFERESLFEHKGSSNFKGYSDNKEAVKRFIDFMSKYGDALEEASEYIEIEEAQENFKNNAEVMEKNEEKIKELLGIMKTPEFKEFRKKLSEIKMAMQQASSQTNQNEQTQQASSQTNQNEHTQQTSSQTNQTALTQQTKQSFISRLFSRIRERFSRTNKENENQNQPPIQESESQVEVKKMINEFILELRNDPEKVKMLQAIELCRNSGEYDANRFAQLVLINGVPNNLAKLATEKMPISVFHELILASSSFDAYRMDWVEQAVNLCIASNDRNIHRH